MMNGNETHLIEQGWSVLVQHMGLVNATKFIMLLDRRTGGGMNHIQRIWHEPRLRAEYGEREYAQYEMEEVA